jgi:hypothetical protein
VRHLFTIPCRQAQRGKNQRSQHMRTARPVMTVKKTSMLDHVTGTTAAMPSYKGVLRRQLLGGVQVVAGWAL